MDLLVEFAGDGPVLHLAVGTGRIALHLKCTRRNGVRHRALSAHGRAAARKPGAEAIAVVVGDMAKERLPDSFELVYVVANSR